MCHQLCGAWHAGVGGVPQVKGTDPPEEQRELQAKETSELISSMMHVPRMKGRKERPSLRGAKEMMLQQKFKE